MNPNDVRLREQIQSLRSLRRECLDARDVLEDVRLRRDEVEQDRTTFLSDLRKQHETQLKIEAEKIDFEAHNRQEQAVADITLMKDSVAERRERSLEELNAALAAQIAEIRQKLQGELWVLQSVCDEQNDDTPVRHAARAGEIQHTQQMFLDQQLTDLRQRLEGVQGYLRECHAATEQVIPKPNIELKGREATRRQAVAEIDLALATAGEVDKLKLPLWISGWRLYGLAGVIFLVTSIGAVVAGTDIRQFLSPELKSPDWNWLGVAALIGFGAAFLTALILLLMVRSRLRSRLERILQHSSNATAAFEFWRQKSLKDLRHLAAAAEKWKVEVVMRREAQAARMQSEAEAKIEALNRAHQDQVRRQLQQFDDQTANSRTEIARQQFAAANWRDREITRIQTAMRADLIRQQDAHDKLISRRIAGLADIEQEAIGTLQAAQSWVLQLVQTANNRATGIPEWQTLIHNGWKITSGLPTVIRTGAISVSMPAAPENADDDLDLEMYVDVPALLEFPRDLSIAVEHDAAGREPALAFIRMLLLRLLTGIMPGRVQFTLIDPVGLGQSFSAMMHLADFDELMIGSRIWTDSLQIRDRLQKVTEHMERIFQTYLRSDYATIEEYNRAAGEVAEPYHFVVIAGFPASFTEEAGRHLTSILTNGPKCGVHTIIAWSPDQTMPRSFDVANLKGCCQQFQVLDGQIVLAYEDSPSPPDVHSTSSIDWDEEFNGETDLEMESVVFAPDEEPAAADYVRLVRTVGEQSRDARRVEVSFSRIAPAAAQFWTHSSAEGVDFPIGRAGAAKLQHMKLGKGTSQHVLIAGKTGSGKSTLLHILITNLSLHYSPDEIQFYLIDFKKGVEFRTYAANKLPHARVVAIESDREFGLSVLERLDEILQERGELFRVRGVQDVPSFRRQFPTERMPRLLLLIDEFQEFFTSEDRVSSRASLLLDRLIRQGRAFGIHVLLGSQTLGGAYSLARSTMGQVAVRIALQCSESDAHLILSEDNSAARLLTRPGEAIYNDANGLVEGNHPFQIAWLDEARREAMIQMMVARPDYHTKSDGRMIVFEGNVPPSIDHCGPLNGWLSAEPDASRHFVDSLPAWIGEPVAIAAPVNLEFRRTGGQNVLIVGQEGDLTDAILASTVASWATVASTSARPRTSRLILLHDGRDQLSRDRFATSFTAEIAPRLLLKSMSEAETVIAGLWEQLTEREAGHTPPDSAELILVIRNIGQFRALRREEDDFGMGGFGAPKAVTAASQLGDLIRKGPAVGIHVMIWADTFSNAMRWLSNSLLREFDYRIAFRLNQTDSSSLIDTPAAAGLGPGRAILYRDQTGAADRFRPFSWPSLQWLRTLAPAVAAPEHIAADDLPLMDIDELFIE